MSDTQPNPMEELLKNVPQRLTVTRNAIEQVHNVAGDGLVPHEAFAGIVLAALVGLETRILELEDNRRRDGDALRSALRG